MAQQRFAKDSNEAKMLIRYMELCQRHWIAEDTQEYADALNSDFNQFADDFKNIPLAAELGVAFIMTKEKEMHK